MKIVSIVVPIKLIFRLNGKVELSFAGGGSQSEENSFHSYNEFATSKEIDIRLERKLIS